MSPAISIIMPAFNEERCIYGNIRTTRAILSEAGVDAEIVAVDDGSSDRTRAEIERASMDIPGVVAARNPYNMGKGMALRTGFEHSSGDIVVFLDADLDLHPSQILTLLSVLDETPCDIVTTSKHHPESKLAYPFRRKVASLCYYLLIKLLFALPVRDTQTGLKVFRRKVLDDVFHRLLVKKFAYDVELLAVAVRFGYRVREVPVVLDFKRELAWGRIKIPDVLSLFVDTLAILYRLRILRYYDAPRPPFPKERPEVLVVVKGCPPPQDVIDRLAAEGVGRIACLAPPPSACAPEGPVSLLPDENSLAEWASREGSGYSFIGFLGDGCFPLGSWVRSAVRNFGDPDVHAVAGPVIPGPLSGWRERAAGMVRASSLSAGFDAHLRSFQTARNIRKCYEGNMFLRQGAQNSGNPGAGLEFHGGFAFSRKADIRYDPDMAVSMPVRPLFLPYLGTVWQNSFREGMRAFDFFAPGKPLLGSVPFVFTLLVSGGWMVLPCRAYILIPFTYLAAVILSGLSYCSPVLALPIAAGLACEHIVRAIAFPAGAVAGLLTKHPSNGC